MSKGEIISHQGGGLYSVKLIRRYGRLNTRLDTINQLIPAVESEITDKEGEIPEAEQAINSIEAEITDIKSDIQITEQVITEQKIIVSDIEDEIKDKEKQIENKQKQITDITDDIEYLQNIVDDLISDCPELP